MKARILIMFVFSLLFVSCKVENVVFTPKEYFICKQWKKDTNGCRFRKFKHVRTIANDKFNNKSQKFIVSLLGEPNIIRKGTYNTGEESVSYEYYFDCSCDKNQKIDSNGCDFVVFLFVNDKLIYTEVAMID